jgi:hypothetical protein
VNTLGTRGVGGSIGRRRVFDLSTTTPFADRIGLSTVEHQEGIDEPVRSLRSHERRG